VLELVRSLEKGGRTGRILDEAIGLKKVGFDVTVASFGVPASWVAARWPQAGRIEVLGLPQRPSPRALWRVSRLIHARRIDLVHTHSEDANLYGGLAARIAGIPVMATFHRSMIGSYRKTLASQLWRRLLDHQVAVSENRRQLLMERLGISEHRISVIPGAADLRRFRPVSGLEREQARASLGIHPEQIVLLGLGHLGRIKGHDLSIRALSTIRQRFPQARLYLAGDGAATDRARLTALVQDLGLADSVKLLGQVHRPEDWLAACDVFVQPPRDEAFGLVFAEAAAAGRPTVSTRVGGIPEIVLDGETGFLVGNEDLKGLASAICRLLEDPELRQRLGTAARRRAEQHFGMETFVASHASLMTRLLPSARRPAGQQRSESAQVASEREPAGMPRFQDPKTQANDRRSVVVPGETAE
jgi:glycosyltransferase involved in cell wall biosynthesis